MADILATWLNEEVGLSRVSNQPPKCELYLIKLLLKTFINNLKLSEI